MIRNFIRQSLYGQKNVLLFWVDALSLKYFGKFISKYYIKWQS